MNKIPELISTIVFVVFIQAIVLIPLTILAFLIRQWSIRGIRKIRYRQKQKLFEKYHMDLLQIPESLHDLIPYAKEFGIADSQERKNYQGDATPIQKRTFARAVRGKEDEILQWLKAIYPKYSKEAFAFAYMLKSMSEMNLLVEYPTSTGLGIEVYANAMSLPITNRVVYYHPRPKNGIEKFCYNLFTAIIAAAIFPVFYYLIIKVWSVFSPHETSVVAFGVICTLTSLLSLTTFKVASWVIKRVSMNMPIIKKSG